MTCQTIELDHSRLKTLLSYDAASGVFAWLEDGRQAAAAAHELGFAPTKMACAVSKRDL